MSEKNYGDNLQLSEIIKYISDTIRFPVLGNGGGFAPIGIINSYMGTVAPIGWLICDGQTYNISDYPDLATHIASQFGSTNFFGGNGTTTFGVPDLRGEFLRGSGTNGHSGQGNGTTVGTHQDATEHVYFRTGAGNAINFSGKNTIREASKYDSSRQVSTNATYSGSDGDNTSTTYPTYYTSRPTNTSVLYIIKATLSDAEIAAYHVYTPREHQVGWWQEEVDGVLKQKPVYEKGYTNLNVSIPYDSWTNFVAAPTNLERFITIFNLHNNEYNMSIDASGIEFQVMSGYIKAEYTQNNGVRKINGATIQYTKTTDKWQTI